MLVVTVQVSLRVHKTSVETWMKQKCASCCELRQELVELREVSEARAREDHDQCVAMFQKMERLVKMNESMTRSCNRSGGSENIFTHSNGELAGAKEVESGDEDVGGNEQTQIRRLQAIVVQQAKELEAMRRKKKDITADGRVQSVASISLGNQLEESQDSTEEDVSTDSDDEDARSDCRSNKHATCSQLRKLPLTSLHAQLKGKVLQIKHLQQVIAKLETRFGQLVDRKRLMAQSFQQTARTQQAHLKKYLSYIRQQTLEKKALERQARELNQYVAVLEKKIVDCSLRSCSRNGQERYDM